ncbi:glycosyltransferase [uncultured Marivita sp.]|uniref:glycosyltransferase n=1 Tax=uncultured Marivita sp. TaxID=888080 RepID=UPI0026023A98|nr:glycosyltransferase [uncultured Marivita sp.]
MADAETTRIISIQPRLGAQVGGGKINAMFQRMNLLADRPDTEIVLLTLDHSCKQKLAFASLQAQGLLDRRITHLSLGELCRPSDLGNVEPGFVLPEWDSKKTRIGAKERTSYFLGKTLVMRDATEHTPVGPLVTRRILTDPNRDVRLKYLNGDLVEGRVKRQDMTTEQLAFVEGHLLSQSRLEGQHVRHVEDFGLGQTFDDEADHHRALFERFLPDDCIVFIDGITVSYLSPAIRRPKVLFLHADHRRPDGSVLQRSRARIDAFDGDAIVTATHVHKLRLHADTRHAAPIRVIPHYTTMTRQDRGPRRNICTVSRLDLGAKPIHHCIEAFIRVMHLIPDCTYEIYGGGLGQVRLEQLIRHHGCADRVILKGPTSDPASVFSGALFSLAPTTGEGFGLSLLESLTCGCPVISYDVDYGPRELIKTAQNGELVPPGDIDALAQAIVKLYTHHAHYAARCEASVQSYGFDAYKKRYRALIDDLEGRGFVFDITAPDMVEEVKSALTTAPLRQQSRLLDLYAQLCEDRRDLGGMYDAFQQKLALLPNDPRPIMRCIWISRRLGRLAECGSHLAHLDRRFPQDHARLIARHPGFLELADAPLGRD